MMSQLRPFTGSPPSHGHARDRAIQADQRGEIDEDARDGNAGDDTGKHAYDQGDGEAPDRPGPQQEEHNRPDDRRHVGVDDSDHGAPPAGLHRLTYTLAGSEAFFDFFVDDDVGIDGDTDREDLSGNSRKRERGVQ